jgi:hypothetical protein
MPFAEDLLEQAYHLARRERTKLKQASLRRAVSTAYYALFHLLIRDAVLNWKRNDQRAALARAFDHGPMKKASQRIIIGKFPGSPPPAVAVCKKALRRLSNSRKDVTLPTTMAPRTGQGQMPLRQSIEQGRFLMPGSPQEPTGLPTNTAFNS